jgi:hypothetical protein
MVELLSTLILTTLGAIQDVSAERDLLPADFERHAPSVSIFCASDFRPSLNDGSFRGATAIHPAESTGKCSAIADTRALLLLCPLTASDQPLVDGRGERLLPTSTNEYFRPGPPFDLTRSL